VRLLWVQEVAGSNPVSPTGVFKVYHKGSLHNFKDLSEMKVFIIGAIGDAQMEGSDIHDITFSSHQEAL